MTETKTIDIDTMPAGREMDALVAEKVMRIKIPCRCIYDCEWLNQLPFDNLDNCQVCGRPYPFAYSTQIAPAWEVWNWAKGEPERWDRFTEQLWSDSQDASDVPIEDDEIIINLLLFISPESICRAAWKAKQ